MQQPSKLGIGQRVEIRFGGDWFPTRLEGIDADRFELAWPTDRERRLLPFEVGDTLELAASAPDDALYSLMTQVVGARSEGLPLLTVKNASAWQRSQRREAVRVPVAIRPRICRKLDDPKPLRAGITNLSANGLQVRSQDEIKPGDVLELAFSVMDIDEELDVQAVVRRVQQHERGTLHIWDAGCELRGLPPRLQQKLVQFIFTQQRALARARKVS